jgi:hypothetical protein
MTFSDQKQYLINESELMKDWDFDANQDLNPAELLIGSNKTAAWVCHLCNNKWKTGIYHRAINGSGCRKCSSRKRVNFNIHESFFITHPDIAKDWSLDKNGRLTPQMFPKNSRYEANWRCHLCGVETTRSIKNYKGCRHCKKEIRLEKANLEMAFPDLSKEWDKEKNKGKLAKDFSPASSQKANWLCSSCGNSWLAKISNRTLLGRGCPLCSNKIVVVGKNDLATTHPSLALEWHPEKNRPLTPQDVTYGSGKKLWWLCPYSHEYQATMLHRAHGTNCPKCNNGRQTSFSEQAIYFYVKKLYPDALNRYSADFLERMELDIYIPSVKLAIEYDGEAWHKPHALGREKRKYQLCKENGIKLIRVREKMPEFPSDIADDMFGMDRLYEPKNLELMLYWLLKRINYKDSWMLSCPVDINISRDRPSILSYKTDLKAKSLKYLNPEIANEWHPTKNGSQLPEHFQPGSTFKAWWRCPDCRNDYNAEIGKRTGGILGKFKTGCPKCGVEKSTAAKRKAVNMINLESGEILRTFISISDASRKMGIHNSNITMVCKGIRSAAGGYFWAYSDT